MVQHVLANTMLLFTLATTWLHSCSSANLRWFSRHSELGRLPWHQGTRRDEVYAGLEARDEQVGWSSNPDCSAPRALFSRVP